MRMLFPLFAAALLAIDGETSAPREPRQAVLRVTTRLIVVNAAVEDKSGKPVAGLTSGDFVLLDKGKQQRIAFFSEQLAGVAVGTAAAARASGPRNVFSNRTQPGLQAPTAATAILFDSLNTPTADQLKAKLRLIESLRRMPPRERVALYAFGSNLMVLHDYTDDMSSLLRTLHRFDGISSGELRFSDPRTANPDLEKVVYDLSRSPSRWDREFAMWLTVRAQATSDAVTAIRIRRTAAALIEVAEKLTGVPGRKNLVWLSGSFPILAGFRYKMSPELRSNGELLRRLPAGTRENLWPELQRAIRVLNDNNIAIYPVDASGLLDDGGYDAERAFTEGSFTGPVPLESLTSPEALQDAHLTMERLAADTGGRASYNTNDLTGAVQRALADSQATYVLGYYPDHRRWDGSYREITVRVKPRGLKTRHRNGYYATATDVAAERPAEEALREAATSPLDATAVGLSVELASVPLKPGLQTLTVGIEPQDLQFQAQPGGGSAATVEVIFAARTAGGRPLPGVRHLVKFNARQVGESSPKPAVEKSIEISPDAAQLRIVVRDTSSGRLGSITLPVTAPPS